MLLVSAANLLNRGLAHRQTQPRRVTLDSELAMAWSRVHQLALREAALLHQARRDSLTGVRAAAAVPIVLLQSFTHFDHHTRSVSP